MEINETKQVLLKDKPLLTVTEAAAFSGIGKHMQHWPISALEAAQ